MVLTDHSGTSLHHRKPEVMSKLTIPLTSNWTFANSRESSHPGKFLPARAPPTEIFTDLLEHGLIPDPFVGKNEREVQWVGEEGWVYRTIFETPEVARRKGREEKRGWKTELVLEGLDTFASVEVNGEVVAESNNMFLPLRVDVSKVLSEGKENELVIRFKSAFLEGKKRREAYPDFAWGCWNGDDSRLGVRKAQYHYGWDWGPMLMSCGPWKPVYLESFISRIEDLSFVGEVREDLKSAKVTVTAEVVGEAKGAVFMLTTPDRKRMKVARAGVEDGKAVTTFRVNNPELWWPHGYGKQPLYSLEAVLDEGADSASKTLGLRRARVVERPLKDQEGESFFFEINNTPIWAAGSNWIPADSFLTTLNKKRYKRWLELARDGRQNMIRVWGGGIYEHDMFYDLCDEMGIMVWQDFLFGCGNYPAQIPEFRQSVQKEVTANIKRLRHHPSIVIYGGNNEDYSYMWGMVNRLGYDPKDTNPENWLKTQFPARYIYEKLLPDTVAELSPNTVYHRGSPYGTPERPDGGVLTTGDCHQWNVWHGTQEPYQHFDKLSARFVSEFGMESFPSMQTIKSYLSHKHPELSAFSSTVEFHNKADGAERRIALYLAENFRFEYNPLDAYIYSTQLMQSDALSTAYRLWRRNWKGEGREYNSGALVWQINDCWPVTSWAIVDYYLRPKIAYHSIRRELAPVVIGAKRKAVKIPRDRRTAAHVEIEHKLEVWVSSFLLEGRGEGWKVVARTFEVASGRLVETMVVREGFVVEANRTVEVAEVNLPGWDGKLDSHLEIAVAVYLLDPQGRHRGRFVSWPEPVKYVPCKKDPGVRIVGEVGGLVQDGEEVEMGKKKGALLKKISVWVETPVKGFVLESRDGTVLDQGVDLVPGEVVEIGVRDLRVGDSVWGRWYTGEVGREFKLVWWEGEAEVEGLRVVEV